MEDSTKTSEILADLRDGVANLSERIAQIELCQTAFRQQQPDDTTPAATFAACGDMQIDPEAEFKRVKASVQSTRLPQDFTLPEHRQGIKRQDQQLYSLIQKNARYCETALKLLSDESVENKSKSESLFFVLYAQIKYLQDECTALVVNSSFDPTVARFFRALQRNNSFTPDALENLRSAATIASAFRPNRGGQLSRQAASQSGRGGFSNFGRGDVFSRQGRPFPGYRGGHSSRGGREFRGEPRQNEDST